MTDATTPTEAQVTAETITLSLQQAASAPDGFSAATLANGSASGWYYSFTGGHNNQGELYSHAGNNTKYPLQISARDSNNDNVVASPVGLSVTTDGAGEASYDNTAQEWQWQDNLVHIKLKEKNGTWRFRIRNKAGTNSADSGHYGLDVNVGSPPLTVHCDPVWHYDPN